MTTYFIKIDGNETNDFQPIIFHYYEDQYRDVLASLKARNISYEFWSSDKKEC